MIRWMILLASLVYLVDSYVFAAQDVPFVNDETSCESNAGY